MKHLWATIMLFFVGMTPGFAALSIIFSEQSPGGNVSVNYTGTLDFSGLNDIGGTITTFDPRITIVPNFRVFVATPTGVTTIVDYYEDLTFSRNDGPYGTNPGFVSASNTGDLLSLRLSEGVTGRTILVPQDYVNRSVLSGSGLFDESLAELGLVPDSEFSYIFDGQLGGQIATAPEEFRTINIRVAPGMAVIPEPSTSAMIALGLLSLMVRRRCRG